MKDYAAQNLEGQKIDRGYKPYTAALIIFGTVAFVVWYMSVVANYLS